MGLNVRYRAFSGVEIVRAGRWLPQLVEAFRTGDAPPPLPWAPEGRADYNRAIFLNLLGTRWLPAIADVLATALLLRTIWVANSLDVILIMTGGGPGYATHTLPLYAFVRAYGGMEYGYAAALALVLTLMLLAVVWLYVRRAARELDR